MAHSFTKLLYHTVFSTKNREPWLTQLVRPRVFEYLGGMIRDRGSISLIVNGIEDHVHLLFRLRQDQTLCDLIREVKARWSLWIHKTYPELEKFSWQTGYGAFTVSQSQAEVVRR